MVWISCAFHVPKFLVVIEIQKLHVTLPEFADAINKSKVFRLKELF